MVNVEITRTASTPFVNIERLSSCGDKLSPGSSFLFIGNDNRLGHTLPYSSLRWLFVPATSLNHSACFAGQTGDQVRAWQCHAPASKQILCGSSVPHESLFPIVFP